MFAPLALSLLIETWVMSSRRKIKTLAEEVIYFKMTQFIFRDLDYAPGGHERRGSEIIAEHLARANVISQSGSASHAGAHQSREGTEGGKPRAHPFLDLCTAQGAEGTVPEVGAGPGSPGPSEAEPSRGACSPGTDFGQREVHLWTPGA